MLVAEDNQTDIFLLNHAAKILDGDTEMDIVQEGDAVLERLREEPGYDILILDLRMPKLDGFEVLRQLQSDSGIRPKRVVIWSSSSAPADVARGRELGADDFITKPDRLAQLRAELQRIVREVSEE